MNSTKYGVLSNHDEDFYSRFDKFTTGKNLTKDNVHELLEEFFINHLSPHISDYVINVGGLSSAVPSKICSFMRLPVNFRWQSGIQEEPRRIRTSYRYQNLCRERRKF